MQDRINVASRFRNRSFFRRPTAMVLPRLSTP